MANSYFNWPTSLNRFIPLDTARAADVNDAFDEVSAGLDGVEADIGVSIKITTATVSQEITESAGVRAGKVITFDDDGNVILSDNTYDSSALSAAAAASSASTASTQAGIATTQAGIATTKASEAAASAASAAATVTSKVSKTGDTMTGELIIDPASPLSDTYRTTLTYDKLAFVGGGPFGTSTYTYDFGNKPSAPIPYGQVDFYPNIKARNGAILNGGITADTSAINIGSGQVVKDTSGNVGIGVANSGGYGGAKLATLDGMSMITPGSKLHLYYISATNRAWIGSEVSGDVTIGTGTSLPADRVRIATDGTTTFVSAAFGYGAGAGGTVTQAVSKNEQTTMAIPKPNGSFTFWDGDLATGGQATFIFTNPLIDFDDHFIARLQYPWSDKYELSVRGVTNDSVVIRLTNITGGTLNERPVFKWAIIKGSVA